MERHEGATAPQEGEHFEVSELDSDLALPWHSFPQTSATSNNVMHQFFDNLQRLVPSQTHSEINQDSDQANHARNHFNKDPRDVSYQRQKPGSISNVTAGSTNGLHLEFHQLVSATSTTSSLRECTPQELCSHPHCSLPRVNSKSAICRHHAEVEASESGRKLCTTLRCIKYVESHSHKYCSIHRPSLTRCSHNGCEKLSQGGGACVQHGGGTRCSVESCQRISRSGGKCAKHGGGARCQVENCNRVALDSRSKLCTAHGGARSSCSVHGCSKHAVVKGVCIAHGGRRECITQGCTRLGLTSGKQVGHCIIHGGGSRCEIVGCNSLVAKDGRIARCRKHGGGNRCNVPSCSRSAKLKGGKCITHGGGYRCKISGCTKGARDKRSMLCFAHGGGKHCDSTARITRHKSNGTPYQTEIEVVNTQDSEYVLINNDNSSSMEYLENQNRITYSSEMHTRMHSTLDAASAQRRISHSNQLQSAAHDGEFHAVNSNQFQVIQEYDSNSNRLHANTPNQDSNISNTQVNKTPPSVNDNHLNQIDEYPNCITRDSLTNVALADTHDHDSSVRHTQDHVGGSLRHTDDDFRSSQSPPRFSAYGTNQPAHETREFVSTNPSNVYHQCDETWNQHEDSILVPFCEKSTFSVQQLREVIALTLPRRSLSECIQRISQLSKVKWSKNNVSSMQCIGASNCPRPTVGNTSRCAVHRLPQRRCGTPGCSRYAKKANMCATHGVSSKCSVQGCTKNKVPGGNLANCIAHGGGKRCRFVGCNNSVPRSRNNASPNLCRTHGGGLRCSVEGCGKSAKNSKGLCGSHGGGLRCKVQGCATLARDARSGKCFAHGGGRHFDSIRKPARKFARMETYHLE